MYSWTIATVVNCGTSVTMARRIRLIHCARNALRVAIEKQRDDFVGQHLVKVGAVDPVLFFD